MSETNKKLSQEEIEEEKSKYTRKIEIPIYEPSDKKPHITELYDKKRTNELIEKINEVDIPEYIKEFLYSAAERHTKFNFAKIADFYAHSNLEVKKLFEDSALVILDYNDAIRNGFISYQKEVDLDLEIFLNNLDEETIYNNLTAVEKKKVKKYKHKKITNDLF